MVLQQIGDLAYEVLSDGHACAEGCNVACPCSRVPVVENLLGCDHAHFPFAARHQVGEAQAVAVARRIAERRASELRSSRVKMTERQAERGAAADLMFALGAGGDGRRKSVYVSRSK